MKRYHVETVETVTSLVTFVVYAENEEQARAAAKRRAFSGEFRRETIATTALATDISEDDF